MLKVSETEFLRAYDEYDGSVRAIAKHFGMDVRGVHRRIQRMVKRGTIVRRTTQYGPGGDILSYSTVEKPYDEAKQPEILDSPVIRQSTMTNGAGEVVSQWNIRVLDDKAAAFQQALDAMQRDLVVLPPRACHRGTFQRSLTNNYVLSDVHVGMVAKNLIENEEWDLDFCSELVIRCFEHMVATSPKTSTAIVTILGDWFHFDSLIPLTPTSGNILIGAANAEDMVEVGIILIRKLIDYALLHHQDVKVVICEGNHDLFGTIWLRKMMKTLYSEEMRIEFIDNNLPFYAYAHGDTFLGYHHGHIKGLKNEKDLALMFADMFPELYGSTTRRYIHTGHLHHLVKKEVAGFTLVQHPTLSAKDNFAARGGYSADRAAIASSYHRKFGQVHENIVTAEMLLSEDGFDIIELNHDR